MKQAYFVAGTDTEIGKTFASCALLHAARAQGLCAVGMKPIAAGTDAQGRNDDVEALIAASSLTLSRATINPYLFAPAVAPHIAAADNGVCIELERITAAYREVAAQADLVIVEGVGGFCVPLGRDTDTADLAVALGLPIILVVGMRLGCINHALLTVEAINRRQLPLAGWIANQIDPNMLRFEDNLNALQERIGAPLLGTIPYLADRNPATAASYLHLK